MTKKKFDNSWIIGILIGVIVVGVALFFIYASFSDSTAKEIQPENNITLTKNNFAVMSSEFYAERYSYVSRICEGSYQEDDYDDIIVYLKILNLPDETGELFLDIFLNAYVNGKLSSRHNLNRDSETGIETIVAFIPANIHEENEIVLCFQIQESTFNSSNEVCLDSFVVESLC
jgi:hypothetical protein